MKTTLRNLQRSKGYTLLNILGLSIGMAAAILILLWIQNELSIDRFHEKGDRTYVMYNRDTNPSGETFAWNATPKVMGPTIKADYPEVEAFSRYSNVTFLLNIGEKKISSRGAFVDSAYLEMFSFPLLQGNTEKVLDDNYSIVLTEELAKSLFGDEEAMGKTVLIDSVHQFTVTGILESLPNNTTFKFDYLIPWSYMDVIDWNDTNWGNNSVTTFVTLKEGTSQAVFDQNVRDIRINHSKNDEMPATAHIFTQPLKRNYLYAKNDNGQLVAGNLVTVRLFSVIATFILLIACINFMNLTTARSERRAKEVGVRKVVGSSRWNLISQFLAESTLLSIISFIIALLIVALSLSAFNDLVGKKLEIPFAEPLFWLSAIGFILLTGILAGSYPAFYLSSFNPVSVLKGTFVKRNAAVNPRKTLVTLQFTFAIVLIISTIIISQQIRYGLERDTGYDQNNIVYVFNEGDVDKNYPLIRNELLSKGAVVSMTRTLSPISQVWSNTGGLQWEGSTTDDEKISFNRMSADVDFAKTFGIALVEGRDIDIHQFPTDSSAILLNESAVKAMRLTDPIGARVKFKWGGDFLHVVGVIKDFVIESPYQNEITPMLVTGPKYASSQVVHLRLNPENTTKANLEHIEMTLNKFNPNYPFNYIFVDENYAKKFQSTERTAKLVTLFAGLTIFISCLGLFGLATYMAESRTKEIGVRKVLGASVANITGLLSREFLLLVLLAFAIASPIAWYAMHKWLEDYSYKIDIEWWVFASTALIAIVITLATVSFQSIRAAVANPVDSLRDE